MARLLQAESDGTLPGFLHFWSHEPLSPDRPGPWVLSQWWEAAFEVDGVRYATAEAFMVAEKARLFGDAAALEAILAAPHPAIAKNAGRLVAPYDDAVWSAARYDVVVRGSLAKFGRHDDLRAYLLSTAPRVLVEASPADPVWGIGLSARDPRAAAPSAWLGENLLGSWRPANGSPRRARGRPAPRGRSRPPARRRPPPPAPRAAASPPRAGGSSRGAGAARPAWRGTPGAGARRRRPTC